MEVLGNIYGNRSQTCCQRVNFTEMLSYESLFIPSRLNIHRSTKSSVRANPQGRSVEKVKLVLNGSHLEPQDVRPQHHHGDDDLE
jgi:hypothetical protein